MSVNLGTSSILLMEKINSWFERPVNFFKSGVGANLPEEGDTVVLFGDFLLGAAELIHRDCPRIKLWVLCQRSREVLMEFFPELGQNTGVIPRYALFPKKTEEKAFPHSGQEWEIVFAGRLSPSKNLLLLIHFVFILQTEFRENVCLKLIGSFDNAHDLSPWGEKPPALYEDFITKVIADLDWKIPPKILPALSPPEWVHEMGPHSVFASLSAAWAEDYGVSVAQAQERGFPVILSDVGAHADVEGRSVLKIPAHLIWGVGFSEFLTNEEEARARAKSIALFFQTNLKRNVHRSLPSYQATKVDPRSDKERLGLLWEAGIHLEKNYLLEGPQYWSDEAHRWFWKRYFRIWAPSTASPQTLFIISPSVFSWPSMRIALAPALGHWLKRQTNSDKLILLNAEKNPPMETIISPSLREVIFFGFSSREHYLARFLRGFNTRLRFIVYVMEGPAHFFYPGKLPPLEDIFESRDLLVLNAEADKRLMSFTYPKASTVIASYFSKSPTPIPWFQREGDPILFYAGRISPQKGLHFLLTALSILGKNAPNLEIIGAPDEVGMRHLGISVGSYPDFINDLIQKLGLADKVKLRSPLPHANVMEEMSRRKLIIASPSVHVDENFGLLARDGLTSGCPAILTRWGGLEAYLPLFDKSVLMVDVHLTRTHLFVNPYELASEISNATAYKGTRNLSLPSHLPDLLPFSESASFEPTDLLRKLRQTPYTGHKVLDEETDREILNSTRETYGGRKAQVGGDALAPWTLTSPGEFIVRDPLMGTRRVLRRGIPSMTIYATIDGTGIQVSSEEFEELFDLGQIFQRNYDEE